MLRFIDLETTSISPHHQDVIKNIPSLDHPLYPSNPQRQRLCGPRRCLAEQGQPLFIYPYWSAALFTHLPIGAVLPIRQLAHALHFSPSAKGRQPFRLWCHQQWRRSSRRNCHHLRLHTRIACVCRILLPQEESNRVVSNVK